MDIYEFKCDKCQTYTETNVFFREGTTMACHVCDKPMERIFTKPALHFKGFTRLNTKEENDLEWTYVCGIAILSFTLVALHYITKN